MGTFNASGATGLRHKLGVPRPVVSTSTPRPLFHCRRHQDQLSWHTAHAIRNGVCLTANLRPTTLPVRWRKGRFRVDDESSRRRNNCASSGLSSVPTPHRCYSNIARRHTTLGQRSGPQARSSRPSPTTCGTQLKREWNRERVVAILPTSAARTPHTPAPSFTVRNCARNSEST